MFAFIIISRIHPYFVPVVPGYIRSLRMLRSLTTHENMIRTQYQGNHWAGMINLILLYHRLRPTEPAVVRFFQRHPTPQALSVNSDFLQVMEELNVSDLVARLITSVSYSFWQHPTWFQPPFQFPSWPGLGLGIPPYVANTFRRLFYPDS
jgi:hypothetical protein